MAMLQEVYNVDLERPDEFPPIRGWTTLVLSSKYEIEEVLLKTRDIWRELAKWGRYFDEDLGEWPSVEEMIKTLPEWFLEAMKYDHIALDYWGEHLHDREWGWWSSVLLGKGIKIDLEAGGLPMSTYCLVLVINHAGGEVIYDDLWIDSKEALKYLAE